MDVLAGHVSPNQPDIPHTTGPCLKMLWVGGDNSASRGNPTDPDTAAEASESHDRPGKSCCPPKPQRGNMFGGAGRVCEVKCAFPCPGRGANKWWCDDAVGKPFCSRRKQEGRDRWHPTSALQTPLRDCQHSSTTRAGHPERSQARHILALRPRPLSKDSQHGNTQQCSPEGAGPPRLSPARDPVGRRPPLRAEEYQQTRAPKTPTRGRPPNKLRRSPGRRSQSKILLWPGQRAVGPSSACESRFCGRLDLRGLRSGPCKTVPPVSCL